MNEYRGSIAVTIELPVKYTVRFGVNPLVMDATIQETCYGLGVLPKDVQAKVLDAIIEAAREQDTEARTAADPIKETP